MAMSKKPTKNKSDEFKEVDIASLEEEQSYSVDSNDLPPDDIVAYNELRSCADLFRLYSEGNLDIQPDFQRQIVWKPPMQTRFIDSLTKQLPIPSMCLSLDYKTQKWKVIDGLQRMASIIKFFSEEEWVLSNVGDVRREISGKKVSVIKTEHPVLYKKIQNVALPVNIIRCDYEKKDHAEYIFTIFHRLNAGGVKLNNQEIRNAIYNGPFNELLREADEYLPWRKLLGVKEGVADRFRRIELVLRFFAFYDKEEAYKSKLAAFLNDYMYDKRFSDNDFIELKRQLFKDTVDILYEKIADGEPLQRKLSNGKVSNALMEALLIGVARNLPKAADKNKTQLKSAFTKIIGDDAFSEKSLSEAIMKGEKVTTRLSVATRSFK